MELIKTKYAGAAVTANSFVVAGSADNTAILASASTSKILGVSGNLDAASGQPFDITILGIAKVKLAGAVTRGDLLTSDSAGLAVELSDTILGTASAHSGGVAMQSGVSGDIIDILVLRQHVSKEDTLTASVAEIDVLDGANATASFTIGTEAANVINVAVQLKNADGADLAVRTSLFAYLSDDANGDSVLTTAHSGGAAIGTDGLLIPVVANKAFFLTSESDGDIDINITETGTKTAYLILRMPNGKLVASTAITHAA
jgi:hypothetical protein